MTRFYPLGGTRPGGPGALGGAGALGGFGAGAGGAGGSGASGVAGVPLSPFPGENTKAPGGHGGAAGGGGGGLGAGGDIFVQSGGQLLIEGGSLTGGGATGGQGGGGANRGGVGQGYGSGIFLQGTSAIVFDPSASQSVVVDDVIADINGSNNAFLGALTLQMNGAGILELGAANTFTGGVELDDGTLKLDVATAAGSDAGLIAFGAAAGRTATLELEPAAQNPGGVFNNQLESFGAGDRIDLVGLTYTGSSPSTAINLGGGSHLIVSEDGQTESFKLQNPGQQTFYAFSDGAGGTFVAGSPPPCYVAGTRILADRGETPVEGLSIGDFVVTARGQRRPIAWIGHRRIDVARHPDPATVRPVRVCANAFGEGLPRRDLWLSPGHNVASEGALMPISALVNGLSVAQIEADRVEYWHVELDAHDILLAEGLPAESYLDCGNRTAFENGGAFIEAHPDFAPGGWVDACLPLMKEGPAVAATKARLLARLAERGLSVEREADAHVVVDGLRIEPVRLTPKRLAFVLPPAGREIALRSKTFIPAHALAASVDSRELGICVARLRIDGAEVALDRDETCGTGWREAEFADGRFARRWTRGAAPLPAGARVVVVDLAGFGHYWRVPEGIGAALFA